MTAADGSLVRHDRRSRWFVPVIAGLIGGLSMTAWLGPSLVSPVYIDWLLHGDYRLHFLGWHLYRTGPWTWPVGAAPLLISPVGSSVGLTDAIPLVALPLKLLAPILPMPFQYIGGWLVLSFGLQGFFGALLLQRMTPNFALQLLGATILILSPPLIFRILHPALTAHWLLLAALLLSLIRDPRERPWRLALAWAALCAAAAATQPYLMLMVIVLMLAASVRHAMAPPRQILQGAAHVVLALGATAVALWQSGSLMVSGDEGLEIGGFGAWSANLLTFVMPTEAGSLFSPGPIGYALAGQYEGYAYLGAGVLMLVAVAMVAQVFSAPARSWWLHVRRHAPLAGALLLLAAMAAGQIVTAGPATLVEYDVAWWGPLTIFRTHGRMIWPLYYGVVLAVLFVVSRFPTRVATALFAAAVILQTVDVWPMTNYVGDRSVFGFRDPLNSRFWTEAAPHYRQLVLVPSNLCAPYDAIDFTPFSLLAGRYGIGINAGETARYDVLEARRYCRALDQEIEQGLAQPDALYIVRRDLLPKIATRLDGTMHCSVVDGFGVCYAKESYARWGGRFDLARSRLPEAQEVARFYASLNDLYRAELGRPPRDAAGDLTTRLEIVMQYLAFRVEGCDDAEATHRALQHGAVSVLCARSSWQPHLPPADQTYAFVKTAEAALRRRDSVPTSVTHVDPEGEAAWVQVYVQERLRGSSHAHAQSRVLDELRGRSR